MNFDIEKIRDQLCENLCAEVEIFERNNRLLVLTPFTFSDGDPYQFYIERETTGAFRIFDAGHTLMHLSYENDIDKFRIGTRGRIFEQILDEMGVEEDDGEIFLFSSGANLAESVFRFGQAITKITDLTFLNRIRVESTFYEDLFEMLNRIVDPSHITKDYIYPNISHAEDYPIDFRIEGKTDPLFVFGVPGRDKARLVTIILERLLREEATFESVIVFSDQSEMPRKDLARLSNVGGEMIASLDASDDFSRKVSRRAA